MKKIIVILIFSSYYLFSQDSLTVRDTYFEYVISFTPQKNEILILLSKWYKRTNKNSPYMDYFYGILNYEHNKISNEISHRKKYICDITEEYILMIEMDKAVFGSYPEKIVILKYFFDSKKIEYILEKKINFNEYILSIDFSKEKNRVTILTKDKFFIIDLGNGKVKVLNEMFKYVDIKVTGHWIDYSRFAHIVISRSGRYFAYWGRKYLTFSNSDETGILRLLDLAWYGIKWLFYFGDIPNKMQIWDIWENKMVDEISIPYELLQSSFAFNKDENILLFGPIENKYIEYNLNTKHVRYLYQDENIPSDLELYQAGQTTLEISPDGKYFANSTCTDDVFVFEYNSVKLVKKFKSANNMVFSDDSKYFAIVYDINKIGIFETDSWTLVWEGKYSDLQSDLN